MSVVVVRNPGHAIPEAWAKKAIAISKIGAGAACVLNDKGKEFLIITQSGEAASLESVVDKERPEQWYLCLLSGAQDQTILDEDLQPFRLLYTENDAGEIEEDIIIAFVTGTFAKYYRDGSEHTNQSNFFTEYLFPKMEEIINDSQFDLDKIVDKIGRDSFKKDILQQLGNDGTLVIVCRNGKHVVISKSEAAKQFDWGWVSDDYGYAVETTKPPVTNKGGFRMPDIKRPGSKMMSSTTPPPDKQPPFELDMKAAHDTLAHDALSDAGTAVNFLVHPFEGAIKAQKKEFYGYYCGAQPSEGGGPSIKKNPPMPILKQKIQEYLQDAKEGKVPPPIITKDTGNHNIPEPEVIVPITSELDKQWFKESFSKDPVTARGLSGPIKGVDISQIQDRERKVPLFTESHNIKGGLDGLDWLSQASFHTLAKERPQQASVLLMEYRREYSILRDHLKKLNEKETPPNIKPTGRPGLKMPL